MVDRMTRKSSESSFRAQILQILDFDNDRFAISNSSRDSTTQANPWTTGKLFFR